MRKDIITYLFLPVICISLLAIVCLKIYQLGYGISYQVSPSMPKGWYLRSFVTHIQRGSLIVFTPEAPYKEYLLKRHLIPNNGWLLKEVVGIPGDYACIKNQQLIINGQAIAALNSQILADMTIPQQTFCGTLSEDEFLVLGRFHPRSYDSRYFGAIKRQDVLGIATPLFIYES